MIEHALSLVQRGFAVFPLTPNGKTPITGHGFQDATLDEDHVKYWWAKNPRANIGLATGHMSNCWVLDVDNKGDANGYETLRALEVLHGALSSGFVVSTPTNGMHFYFSWNTEKPVRNSTNKVGAFVDTRGEGGYVVAPGSVRKECEYVIVSDGEPSDAPEWLMDLLEVKHQPPKPLPQIIDLHDESQKAERSLQKLALWRTEDYDAWVRVGMALHQLGDEGLRLWEWWSSRSKKYKQGECQKKWGGFNGSVSLGSLVYWAEQDSPSYSSNSGTPNYAAIIRRGL